MTKKDNLEEYKKKRDFRKTKEPSGEKGKGRIFVVQKHKASHLHYDFRLAINGVLKSWAIPKGPSMDPKQKRLAIQVEDHPFDYKDFEGVIPEDQYGAGTVIVWDKGRYENRGEKSMEKGLEEGEVKFKLKGQKLKGEFALVNMQKKQWLLIKKKDKYAGKEVNDERSVKSGKKVGEIE